MLCPSSTDVTVSMGIQSPSAKLKHCSAKFLLAKILPDADFFFLRASVNHAPFPLQGQNIFSLPWLAACQYGIQVSGVKDGFHMIRQNYFGI